MAIDDHPRVLLDPVIAGYRRYTAAFLRYSYEQGLSKRLLEPERLFARETLESFRI